MSESAATAWIIERLEVENTKMQEEMGNMDTCQDNFDGTISGVAITVAVLTACFTTFRPGRKNTLVMHCLYAFASPLAEAGGREAYNRETTVNDDTGFLCDGEATDMIGSRQREARGTNDIRDDCSWREMYR